MEWMGDRFGIALRCILLVGVGLGWFGLVQDRVLYGVHVIHSYQLLSIAIVHLLLPLLLLLHLPLHLHLHLHPCCCCRGPSSRSAANSSRHSTRRARTRASSANGRVVMSLIPINGSAHISTGVCVGVDSIKNHTATDTDGDIDSITPMISTTTVYYCCADPLPYSPLPVPASEHRRWQLNAAAYHRQVATNDGTSTLVHSSNTSSAAAAVTIPISISQLRTDGY